MTFNRDGKTDCPCKGCDERHEACHDRCERYRAWQATVAKRNEARRAAYENADLLSDAQKRNIWRKQRYSSQGRKLSSREQQ